jgi:hypothetical protein
MADCHRENVGRRPVERLSLVFFWLIFKNSRWSAILFVAITGVWHECTITRTDAAGRLVSKSVSKGW